MSRNKHRAFQANAQRPQVASSVATDVQAAPALVRQSAVNAKGDAPSVPLTVLDDLSSEFGATWYVTGHRINGCEDLAGRRYLFSRWYPDQNILVDSFSNATDAVKLEVARKRAFLDAYNESAERKIGYLPYVVGADLNAVVANEALRGEVVSLQTPQPLTV